MEKENEILNEAKRRFMYKPDAEEFVGGPIRDNHAKRVMTDSCRILFRLDWLLAERQRRCLPPPQLLCNRNTGQLNRVRVDGRSFWVKPCRDVLIGDELLT